MYDNLRPKLVRWVRVMWKRRDVSWEGGFATGIYLTLAMLAVQRSQLGYATGWFVLAFVRWMVL